MFVELGCDTVRSKRSWVLASDRRFSSRSWCHVLLFQLLDLLADYLGVDGNHCFIFKRSLNARKADWWVTGVTAEGALKAKRSRWQASIWWVIALILSPMLFKFGEILVAVVVVVFFSDY